MNFESPNFLVKSIRKLKHPLGTKSPLLLSTCALTQKPKSKNNPEEKRTFLQKIKDNCGIIAAVLQAPFVAEEAIANIRGNKITKQSGLPNNLLKIV